MIYHSLRIGRLAQWVERLGYTDRPVIFSNYR